MAGERGGEEEGSEAPLLHGDVLEEIICRISPLDLAPASRVSRPWCRAVFSTLRRSSRVRIPWLIIHLQSHRDLSRPVLTHAYDPHSRVWIPIPRAPRPACVLRCSHPGLLQALSVSKLVISIDAFGSMWREMPPPRVLREDAVVALVGSRVVVAGGAFDFEDEPLAVETCPAVGGVWEACEPMPEEFTYSAAGAWLSVTATDTVLYVMEKREGMFCSFDPETKRWGRTCNLRPDPGVRFSAIGLAGDRLILVGAAGDGRKVETITLWEVDRGTLECKEIGRMPPEMVGRLVGDNWGPFSSVGFSIAGGFCYLYNQCGGAEMFLCELEEGTCRWASIGSPAPAVIVDRNPMHRMLFTCSMVGTSEMLRTVVWPAVA